MNLAFHKYQGLGNDFVLFDGEALKAFDPIDPLFIRWICDRRFGVGADGILLAVPPLARGAVRMIYYNADGSFSETCFNGLRCTALHAAREGWAKRGENFIVESPTGDVIALVETDSDLTRIELAGPSFEPEQVPVKSTFPVIESLLDVAGMPLTGTALSIGNPHFVVWRGQGDLEQLNRDSRLIGASVEKAEVFPRMTNFELARAVSPTEAIMAVWERGVGPTLACGSGATATVCAGVKAGRLNAGVPVKVRMAGGDLQIEVSPDFARVAVVGGATYVFSGSLQVPTHRGIHLP